MAGLEDRSRAPKSATGRTADEVERLIVGERRLHPTWGGKEDPVGSRDKARAGEPSGGEPVGAVLTRHGMIKARRGQPGVFKVERGELTVAER